jgi:hypothetical protein
MAGRHDETMAGYGQGFFTQAALMIDCVNAYTLCLNGYARLAYDGTICQPLTYERDPWLIHECFNLKHYEQGLDHTFGQMCGDRPGGMDNPGDEGNLVQMVEGLKAFRLVAGVNDLSGDRLLLMPRMPWDWERLTIENFPFHIGERQGRVTYRMTNDLARGQVSLEWESDLPGVSTEVRLGPLPRSVPADGLPGRVEDNVWARWIWLDGNNSGGGRVSLAL